MALPGVGISGQKILNQSIVRLVGSGPAVSACRLYLERGGVGLADESIDVADFEIHFGIGSLRARRALLISAQEDGNTSMGYWSQESGPCGPCLWKGLPPVTAKGSFLDGATAATAVLIGLLEPDRWQAGGMVSWGGLNSSGSIAERSSKNCSHTRIGVRTDV